MTSKDIMNQIKEKEQKIERLQTKIHSLRLEYYRLSDIEEQNKGPEPEPNVDFLNGTDGWI